MNADDYFVGETIIKNPVIVLFPSSQANFLTRNEEIGCEFVRDYGVFRICNTLPCLTRETCLLVSARFEVGVVREIGYAEIDRKRLPIG